MRGLKLLSIVSPPYSIVASFTDAWIETIAAGEDDPEKWSHLLQMRGLKHSYIRYDLVAAESHLLQMRGLKHHRSFKGQEELSRIFYRCVD